MMEANRTVHCPACRHRMVIPSGYEYLSGACSRCGMMLNPIAALDLPVSPPRSQSARTHRLTLMESARILGESFLAGLVAAVALGAVLGLALGALFSATGGLARTGMLFGADTGFLLGGFLVGTWKAVRGLELGVIGGAVLGATLGLLTAGIHIALEKLFFSLPEASSTMAVVVGLLAGLAYGLFLGASNEED